MADQKRLPSEVLVVEQSRIAAALAIREEIARLEKLATELVDDAHANLAAEFGDTASQVICGKIVDAFTESGLPENCITEIPGLGERLNLARGATTPPIELNPDDHPPHDFYGVVLSGRNAILGHQIVEEARTIARSGGDGKGHRYSRLFGKHSWKKDVFQAAFNEELGLPPALPLTAEAKEPVEKVALPKADPRPEVSAPPPQIEQPVFPDPPIDGEVGIGSPVDIEPVDSEARPGPEAPEPRHDAGGQQPDTETLISEQLQDTIEEPDHEPADEDLPFEVVEDNRVEVTPEPIEVAPLVARIPPRTAARSLPVERPIAIVPPSPTVSPDLEDVIGYDLSDEEDMTFGDADDLGGSPPELAVQPVVEAMPIVSNAEPEPDLSNFLPPFLADQDDSPPATSIGSRNFRPPPPPPGRRPMKVAPGL